MARFSDFGSAEEAAARGVDCNCGAAVGEPCDWRSGHDLWRPDPAIDRWSKTHVLRVQRARHNATPTGPLVVRLASPEGPVPGVVELLEDMLAKARSGEIRGIAIATCKTGRTTSTAHDMGDGGCAPLYLGVGFLAARLLAAETT